MQCALDFIEPSSVRRENTSTFNVWVSTSDPFAIAKAMWLTNTAPADGTPASYAVSLRQPLPRREPRRRCCCRLTVHLDQYIDLSARVGGTRQDALEAWWL